MPLTRRQAEAEGRKDEVEREYEEAIGHGKSLTKDKEEDDDNILGKHDLSSPEEEELRKKSRSERGTEIQDESKTNSMLMTILEELRELKAYTIARSKKYEENMKKLDLDVNRAISEVHATREKLAEDEQTIQEMAKNEDQKMEDITSKNKFLCEHLDQFEVDVRSVLVKHDKYCEDFAKHINDHETDNKRVIDEMKESLKKHDISFENITKDLNDRETDNKRIIKEMKEDLIVQQASIENENARRLKEIDERLSQQLDGRVRKFEDLINDNSKEITKLIATETSKENNYKLLNEDIKKLNIDMNLLKISKSQNRELQNSLKTKMEEQGEKVIVLQQQNQYLMENTIYENCPADEMDDSDNTTSEETDTDVEKKEDHDLESDDEQDKEGDAYHHGMFRMTTSKEEGHNNNSGKQFMVITLLDSGANSNFVYQAVIEEMKRSPDTILTQKNMQNTIFYRLLSIEQTDKRHTVETADEPVLVNSRAMINVEIHSNESSFNFSAWFLILPRMKNMIILGKPSLFKLKYELQPPNKECFTIDGHKYYFEFTDAKGAYKLMELPNDSLLQQLKGTYPAQSLLQRFPHPIHQTLPTRLS